MRIFMSFEYSMLLEIFAVSALCVATSKMRGLWLALKRVRLPGLRREDVGRGPAP